MIPDIRPVITNNPRTSNVGIGVVGTFRVNDVEVQNNRVQNVRDIRVADTRIWMSSPPQAIPPTVPVTTIVGTPIVDMPGCVKVHKENAKNPKNRNKALVNDDPEGNTVLCDNGAPYYHPPNYDARQLTWQTIYGEPPEEISGLDTGEPPAPITPETPEAPKTPPTTAEDVPCPPPNARRIGDLNQAGTERVKGY